MGVSLVTAIKSHPTAYAGKELDETLIPPFRQPSVANIEIILLFILSSEIQTIGGEIIVLVHGRLG